MSKNELLPKINAEKNTLALEQAQATLQAAEGDLRAQAARR